MRYINFYLKEIDITPEYLQVPESDHQQLEKTSERLEALHSSVITVQKAVQPVQTFYLSNTQKKVVEFSMSVKEFHNRFETQGPGAVGEDLEKGVKLLKVSFIYC